MELKHHFLSCIILMLILFPFFKYYSLIIFIFGFFIDMDHYLYDSIITKKFGLINSYKMHMDKSRIIKDQLHVFHTLEFITLIIALTFVSKNVYLLLLSTGLVLHLILDLIYHIYLIRNNIEMKQTRAASLIMWSQRNLFN